MKKILMYAAVIGMFAGPVLAGGFGFYTPPNNDASASVAAGAGSGTYCSGHCQTGSISSVETGTTADTRPSASFSYDVGTMTGGFGYARNGLSMDSGMSGGGSGTADAGRSPVTSNSGFDGQVLSQGMGDVVMGAQVLGGSASGSGYDSNRSESSSAGARAFSAQDMTAMSSGGHLAESGVYTQTDISVEASADDGYHHYAD